MKALKFLPVLLLLILGGCSVGYELSQQNLSKYYDPEARFTRPEFVVSHLNDSITNIYIRLYLPDFLYTREKPTSAFKARIEISYALFESYESKKVLDSAAIFLTDSVEYGTRNSLLEVISVKARKPGDYILKTVIGDVSRNQEIICYLPVNKSTLTTSQSFLLLDRDSNILFRNYLSDGEKVRLKYINPEVKKLYVRYYKREFPVARPPFVLDKDDPFNYKSDSVFTVDLNQGISRPFQLDKEGFYCFLTDSAIRQGFTLYRYYNDFPVITAAEHIVSPLRYICTQREYDILTASSNPKLTADSFWLVNTGHPNRARQQISKYYNRVQEANELFSSYLEGWKTDRGMVYIVFGPPNYVYRATNVEIWVYGEAGVSSSLRFSFIRVNNPFSYADYSLYRNPMFKEPWYNTVENWRR